MHDVGEYWLKVPVQQIFPLFKNMSQEDKFLMPFESICIISFKKMIG